MADRGHHAFAQGNAYGNDSQDDITNDNMNQRLLFDDPNLTQAGTLQANFPTHPAASNNNNNNGAVTNPFDFHFGDANYATAAAFFTGRAPSPLSNVNFQLGNAATNNFIPVPLPSVGGFSNNSPNAYAASSPYGQGYGSAFPSYHQPTPGLMRTGMPTNPSSLNPFSNQPTGASFRSDRPRRLSTAAKSTEDEDAEVMQPSAKRPKTSRKVKNESKSTMSTRHEQRDVEGSDGDSDGSGDLIFSSLADATKEGDDLVPLEKTIAAQDDWKAIEGSDEVQREYVVKIKAVIQAAVDGDYLVHPPDFGKIHNVIKTEWHRYQKEGVRKIRDLLKKVDANKAVELAAWSVLDEVLKGHKFGLHRTKFLMDTTSIASQRLDACIAAIKGMPIVALDVLDNKKNEVKTLVATPGLYRARKIDNRWINFDKALDRAVGKGLETGDKVKVDEANRKKAALKAAKATKATEHTKSEKGSKGKKSRVAKKGEDSEDEVSEEISGEEMADIQQAMMQSQRDDDEARTKRGEKLMSKNGFGDGEDMDAAELQDDKEDEDDEEDESDSEEMTGSDNE